MTGGESVARFVSSSSLVRGRASLVARIRRAAVIIPRPPGENRDDALVDLHHQSIAGRIRGRIASGVGVPGVPGLHAYAILNFDAPRDEVMLWNPIGGSFHPKGPEGLRHGYPVAHGQFRVPLTELVQFFGGFSFES
jgi:hypothetical protein